MNDFLGNPLAVGDYVAMYGGGNSGIGYGMVLHQITEFRGDQVVMVRLGAAYVDGDYTLVRKETKSRKTTAMVKVSPPAVARELLANPERQQDMACQWLHGMSPMNWEDWGRSD